MKGFKGFNPDFTCRGKQYEENKIFEEETAEICESGMHFCENPFEVLRYYDLVNKNGKINEFAEVEALDEAFTDDNKKFCTKKLKIGAKLGLEAPVTPHRLEAPATTHRLILVENILLSCVQDTILWQKQKSEAGSRLQNGRKTVMVSGFQCA